MTWVLGLERDRADIDTINRIDRRLGRELDGLRLFIRVLGSSAESCSAANALAGTRYAVEKAMSARHELERIRDSGADGGDEMSDALYRMVADEIKDALSEIEVAHYTFQKKCECRRSGR